MKRWFEMASSVKMLGVGMAVMLLVLKPEIGLAIVNGVSVGVQGIAESFQKESDKEPEENIFIYILLSRIFFVQTIL